MSTIEPRRAVVTIYQGDYLDRIRHLEQRWDAAVKAEEDTPRMLSDASEAAALAEEHKALVAEAEKDAISVTVQALGRKAWRELVAAHQARPDNTEDELLGVNLETFKDPLVAASIVEPQWTEEDLDLLSEIDNDRIFYSAFALNRSPANSPKALPASQASQQSDET